MKIKQIGQKKLNKNHTIIVFARKWEKTDLNFHSLIHSLKRIIQVHPVKFEVTHKNVHLILRAPFLNSI